MCELATIATIASIAGTGMQAFGAYQTAQSQKSAYAYQARVAQNNATMGEWQAQDAMRRGERAEIDQRRKTAQLKGAQTASLAARGLDIGTGSALNILSDTDYLGEIDALTIRDNGRREAWAYRQGAQNDANSAGVLRATGNAISPLGAGATSLLTSAPQVARHWYDLKGKGG